MGIYLAVELLGCRVRIYLVLVDINPSVSQYYYSSSHSHQTVFKSSDCSTVSPALSIFCHFNFRNHGRFYNIV